MRTVSGRVAAVTGAASGIGRALATELARRGADLALCDVDDIGLDDTVMACKSQGAHVTSQHLDVSRRDDVYKWADRVVADHGRANMIVNNAGVALSSEIATMSYEDMEWLFGINFWGVVHGTKAFLPHLEASGEGHVINVSSVFGLVSVPTQSAYNAAKFAVRGFTDALRMELEIARSPVSCTTVHPGGIRTNIARNSRMAPHLEEKGGGPVAARERFDRVARTSPERAACQILDAVARNRRRVLVGPDAKAIDLVARLPVTLYQRAFVAGARLSR